MKPGRKHVSYLLLILSFHHILSLPLTSQSSNVPLSHFASPAPYLEQTFPEPVIGEMKSLMSNTLSFPLLQSSSSFFLYLLKSHPPHWRNNVILISEGSELSSVAPSPFICPFFISFLDSWLRINDSGDANINYGSYGYHLLSTCHDPGSGTNYWHSEISFDLTISH